MKSTRVIISNRKGISSRDRRQSAMLIESVADTAETDQVYRDDFDAMCIGEGE